MDEVCVIGGAGYVGSIVSQELMAKRFYVSIIDNQMYSKEYNNPHIMNLDILDSDISNNTYDKVVWLCDIDVEDFYANPVADAYIEKNLKVFTELAEKYGSNLITIIDCNYYNNEVLMKFIEDKRKICDKYDCTYAECGQIYGPSTRMRFDTTVNMMFWEAYQRGFLGVSNYLDITVQANVKNVADYIVDSVIGNDAIINNQNISNIECANLVADAFGDDVRIIRNGAGEGASKCRYYTGGRANSDITKACKFMLSMLEKNMITDIEAPYRFNSVVLMNALSGLDTYEFVCKLCLKDNSK